MPSPWSRGAPHPRAPDLAPSDPLDGIQVRPASRDTPTPKATWTTLLGDYHPEG